MMYRKDCYKSNAAGNTKSWWYMFNIRGDGSVCMFDKRFARRLGVYRERRSSINAVSFMRHVPIKRTHA